MVGENPQYKGEQNETNPASIPPQNERKIFVLVGFIGVVALFLGFMQLLQHIKSPFVTVVNLSNTTVLTNEQISALNNLKNKDTDGDGLSDYDELYVYNTSPYLKDSDSDSISDKEEISNGTDPNCPAGQNCSGTTNTNSSTSANTNRTNSSTNSEILSGNIPASTLRDTLKNAGVPQSVLDSYDDQTLLEIYSQTIQEAQSTNTNASSNTNAAQNTNSNRNISLTNISSDTTSAILSTLTPAEIRSLLLQTGLTENDLGGVDDATLQAIFLQAIQEQQSSTNTNING